jgi:membrane-associated phospholipid phosphatase
MKLGRRQVTLGLMSLPFASPRQALAQTAAAQSGLLPPEAVLSQWYRLVLELVRHTATYSPPVASRAFAYLGITAYEVAASSPATGLRSLAGQLHGLTPPPACDPALSYAMPAMLHGAMAAAVMAFFGNTGPTGQRAMAAMDRILGEQVAKDTDPATLARSRDQGAAVAQHMLDWSLGDGGATVVNMGFPYDYPPPQSAGDWVPTSLIAVQQTPLLPDWGRNRPFAMPAGQPACGLTLTIPYSAEPESAFYQQAAEVVAIKAALTDEQKLIARFWSDDPMLSPTPPGHWISIAMAILDRDAADLATWADVLARLGITIADAFIACWQTKYDVNLLRPVTYIRQVMGETKWEPLLNTPPFPEFPSGHSSQSGAAAAVLTAIWGEGFAFDDATHADDGLPVRHFPSFAAAAEEAALSRLYGGIHFREGVEAGLAQGRCVGAYTVALQTRV